jgi:hypothetical protein
MKKRILLVGDYNRSDFLYPAKLLHSEVDFYFIEFVNEHFLKNKECLEYGFVIYWKNYKDAYDLLDKIRPEKIVFYFIESFNHVALNVAAKSGKIPTYHLEHGLRFSLNSFLKENNRLKKISNRIKAVTQLRHVYDRYAGRMFFRNTIKKSSKKESEFLSSYYSIRKKRSIRETSKEIRDPLRLPDKYISFSPLIFDYHKKLEGLSDSYPVYYVGIPFFDRFFKWKALCQYGENILFIDQPLHEKKFLKWTAEFKEKFLRALINMARSMDKKLYIKPHPWNDKFIYRPFLADIILVEESWEAIVPDINITLGFASTLLMPFMAMDHIACFTIEMHPQKTNPEYSDFLLRSKACHSVDNFEDLSERLKNSSVWHQKQKDHKNYFIENWMYCFDGKSSERLRKALIKDETV